MSETVGIILIFAGIGASGAGMYFLSQSKRQVIGLALMVIGLFVAGIGFLAIDDTQVEERPPATIDAGSPGATPES